MEQPANTTRAMDSNNHRKAMDSSNKPNQLMGSNNNHKVMDSSNKPNKVMDSSSSEATDSKPSSKDTAIRRTKPARYL